MRWGTHGLRFVRRLAVAAQTIRPVFGKIFRILITLTKDVIFLASFSFLWDTSVTFLLVQSVNMRRWKGSKEGGKMMEHRFEQEEGRLIRQIS